MFSLRCHHLVRTLFNVQTTLTPIELPASNPITNGHKSISTTSILLVDYYQTLGIPAKSTQNEIKAAYYKLSMIYHPDKNQGSESAAQKFREITKAYEVLSNYRLRRLYDKGIIHTAGSQYAEADNIRSHPEDIEEEDDAQTKFYKSRFTKSKVANARGQTPIYDFDEWAKAHYGKSMDRKKQAQQRYERKTAEKKNNAIVFQKELVIYSILIGTVLMVLVANMESSYDNPRTRRNEKAD